MRRSIRITRVMASAAAVAFGFGLGFPTEVVASTILFDNTGGLTETIDQPGNDQSLVTEDRGFTFTVGADAFTLNKMIFGMYGDVAGDADVGLRLYAGSAASGTALQTVATVSVALETVANGGTLVTFDTVGWMLNANTQYTVAAYGVADEVTPRLGSSDRGSFDPGWTVSGLVFNGWRAGTSEATDPYYVQLSGTFATGAVPGAGLAGLATVGLAGISRRRRR